MDDAGGSPAHDSLTEDEKDHVDLSGPAAPSNVSTTKPRKALLTGFITLSSADEHEEDMRAELQYATKRGDLFDELHGQEKEIQRLVASHCGLASPDLVQVPEMIEETENKIVWLHGSFNVCIPIRINNSGLSLPPRIGFRVPLPYKIGEEAFPGNAEEKVRSEAATYIWISENCPDIPIPKLRGFGVPGGLSFFQPTSVSLWQRIKFYVRRFIGHLYRDAPFCDYIPRKRRAFLEHGYMLMDWVESGDAQTQMLSKVFSMPHTEAQTQNLYRSMSKVMISLAKISQPRIGSWTIDNEGRISLSNRPLLCHLHQLENWAIPTDIPRGMTYSSADSFYLDLLAGHDNRLRYQENAAYSERDARAQAKNLVLMKALLHEFTNRGLREGPFVMQLTDMHTSNIFIDENWNIKHIIDLEWACSLSLENLVPPFWLTGKCVDQIEDEEYERFKACYEQFVQTFKEEEMGKSLYHNGKVYSRAMGMSNALEDGRYWYWNALQTPKGLFNIFRTHLQVLYDKVSKDDIRIAISPFWTPGMASFVSYKLERYAHYRQEVRDIFNNERTWTEVTREAVT